MNEENSFNFNEKKPLSLGQKITAGVLIFGAVLVFGFGIWQIKRSINAPFERKTTANTNQQGEKNTEDGDTRALRAKDTDQDGLSDYDEMYVYQTSPYIADSDSDGILDKKEIDSGTDPNCPIGKTCNIITPNSVNTDEQQPEINVNTNTNSIDLNSLINLQNSNPPASVNSNDLNAALPADLPPAQIRELLKQSGMPENVLEKFTDEQLIKAYNETLKKVKK